MCVGVEEGEVGSEQRLEHGPHVRLEHHLGSGRPADTPPSTSYMRSYSHRTSRRQSTCSVHIARPHAAREACATRSRSVPAALAINCACHLRPTLGQRVTVFCFCLPCGMCEDGLLLAVCSVRHHVWWLGHLVDVPHGALLLHLLLPQATVAPPRLCATEPRDTQGDDDMMQLPCAPLCAFTITGLSDVCVSMVVGQDGPWPSRRCLT